MAGKKQILVLHSVSDMDGECRGFDDAGNEWIYENRMPDEPVADCSMCAGLTRHYFRCSVGDGVVCVFHVREHCTHYAPCNPFSLAPNVNLVLNDARETAKLKVRYPNKTGLINVRWIGSVYVAQVSAPSTLEVLTQYAQTLQYCAGLFTNKRQTMKQRAKHWGYVGVNTQAVSDFVQRIKNEYQTKQNFPIWEI